MSTSPFRSDVPVNAVTSSFSSDVPIFDPIMLAKRVRARYQTPEQQMAQDAIHLLPHSARIPGGLPYRRCAFCSKGT